MKLPNGQSITNSIREASIDILVLMLDVRKLSLRQVRVILNKIDNVNCLWGMQRQFD